MADKQRDKIADDFEEDVVPPYKRGKGRPTKYNPKFCEDVIEYMSQGYSATAAAGYIGVSRSTLYKWADENPDFSDALKTGQVKAALWWETVARGIAVGQDGNATIAIFGLKNRAQDDWRDRKEVAAEHSGKIETQVTAQDLAQYLAKLSPEQRTALEALRNVGSDEN